MAVTIYAIAERAGVSSSTVARALRGDVKSLSGRSAERAQRIRKLAKEMGYQRNWRAQAFSRCKTHAVGLFHTHTAWIHEGTMGEIAGGFTMGMRDHGYHVVIVPYDSEGEWHELLRDGRLDGIAISHYLPDDAREAVEESGLPRVLLMDKTIRTWSCAVADDEGGAYLATRRLLHLGHRRIAMYLHDSIRKHFSVDDRHAGYEKAMKEAGLQDAIRFCHLPEEELPRVLFAGDDRPTAVLCYCHVEAMAVYLAAWQHGVKIPDDLSVIAFNELQFAHYMTPPLTTMAFNTAHIGRVGANLLVRQIETKDAEPERVVLTEKLMERLSTAPPRS
ncbi:MAG: LacI family DNA-binding transcriptional regulator [Pirellulales bacterium]|nr:LacI family DNA-binding transcriptional regulator [Pirellulales bacterium]